MTVVNLNLANLEHNMYKNTPPSTIYYNEININKEQIDPIYEEIKKAFHSAQKDIYNSGSALQFKNKWNYYIKKERYYNINENEAINQVAKLHNFRNKYSENNKVNIEKYANKMKELAAGDCQDQAAYIKAKLINNYVYIYQLNHKILNGTHSVAIVFIEGIEKLEPALVVDAYAGRIGATIDIENIKNIIDFYKKIQQTPGDINPLFTFDIFNNLFENTPKPYEPKRNFDW